MCRIRCVHTHTNAGTCTDVRAPLSLSYTEKDKMQEDAAAAKEGKAEAGSGGGEAMDEDKGGDAGKADVGMKEGGQARQSDEEGECCASPSSSIPLLLRVLLSILFRTTCTSASPQPTCFYPPPQPLFSRVFLPFCLAFRCPHWLSTTVHNASMRPRGRVYLCACICKLGCTRVDMNMRVGGCVCTWTRCGWRVLTSPCACVCLCAGEELVWMRTIRGRLMHIARAYAAQIYECHEMLEDEVQPIKIDDPALRRLVATVQRIR